MQRRKETEAYRHLTETSETCTDMVKSEHADRLCFAHAQVRHKTASESCRALDLRVTPSKHLYDVPC